MYVYKFLHSKDSVSIVYKILFRQHDIKIYQLECVIKQSKRFNTTNFQLNNPYLSKY